MDKPTSRTAFALLHEMTSHDPDHECIVDGERRWSYGKFVKDVQRSACALLAHGIERGDRVGILAGNCAEWLIADFAIMSLGAISVGLNTWSSANELAYQLEHSGVRLLFIEPTFRDRDFMQLVADARAIAGDFPILDNLVVIADKASAPHISWETFNASAEQVTDAKLAAAQSSVEPTDVACLLYTSGSTALPKGVPLLHRGLIENMWEIGERQQLDGDDRLWLAVSLFWSLACVNALFALLSHRGTIVLQHHFDAGAALQLIEQERCSVFYGTPNMALALTEHPDLAKHDLGSLRTGVTIGTPPQIARVAELGVAQICNVYGLTEAYGNSTVTEASLAFDKRIETVGRGLQGVEVRTVDANDVARPTGEVGEVQLRGNVTPGYWNDPERTAESFTEDGWFRTGDLGLLDDDGYLYYRGRLKEMVKTGGINVAPAEVEQALSTHAAIELAFVTGIPDPRLDETLAAVIVLRKGHTADEASLREHCRETLAPYKTPRHFRFVDAAALPLTTTGKLQRKRLGEFFGVEAV
ncbi:MAG: fatty-acyl-CoA synthase [Gammaproteobacteria bacterium]|jgi:fatty-acyl-CoA synthase